MNDKKLKALYEKVSKHSNYQILPDQLKQFLNEKELSITSRFEKERFDYFTSKVNAKGKKIIDVGGNTGYFTFEFLSAGAKKVIYYEGNKAHADFVETASNVLNANIEVKNTYLHFNETSDIEKSDLVLLLNVIHHLGDDFGNSELAREDAKKEMKNCLNFFADKTETLIFQMGYCWKGDINKLLFEHGTKQEMISFIENSIKGFWKISSIGIAEEVQGETTYKDLTSQNAERINELGEFRNRPIFILNSLKA